MTLFDAAPYNIGSWDVSKYYTHQIHTVGQHKMISTFHVSVGGLWSKTLGFPVTNSLGAWKGGEAFDFAAFELDGTIAKIPVPARITDENGVVTQQSHLYQLNNDADYCELHRPLKFINGRYMVKDYAHPSGPLSADSYEDFLDAVVANNLQPYTTNGGILFGMGLQIDHTYAPLANPSAKVFFPLGAGLLPWNETFTLQYQKNGITNGYGSQDPFELGQRIFAFFFNNVPFLSGATYDIDVFFTNTGLSNAPISRSSDDASRGLLAALMPQSVDTDILTSAEFTEYLNTGSGRDPAEVNMYATA